MIRTEQLLGDEAIRKLREEQTYRKVGEIDELWEAVRQLGKDYRVLARRIEAMEISGEMENKND